MRILFANGLFWTSVACCFIAQLLIIRSVDSARHLPARAASMPRQREGLEMLWAILPAIGLAALLLFTWRAVQRSSARAPTDRAVPAEVTA
jgi:heme/copper-type cytochrome/quinol oxidase subunit 2